MKRNLIFEEVFACSIERLWRAITDPAELETWLMPNDFVAEVGHQFQFQAIHMDNPRPIECAVLRLSPHESMAWSWQLDGKASEVIFEISSTTDKQTRLKLSHTGLQDPRMAEMLQNGWPGKLQKMGVLVQGQ